VVRRREVILFATEAEVVPATTEVAEPCQVVNEQEKLRSLAGVEGKSGVGSSFLPEKMHRLRITRREKTNRLRITRVLNRSVGKMHLFGKDADFEAFQRVMIEAH